MIPEKAKATPLKNAPLGESQTRRESAGAEIRPQHVEQVVEAERGRGERTFSRRTVG
jgi:hypothetical protein